MYISPQTQEQPETAKQMTAITVDLSSGNEVSLRMTFRRREWVGRGSRFCRRGVNFMLQWARPSQGSRRGHASHAPKSVLFHQPPPPTPTPPPTSPPAQFSSSFFLLVPFLTILSLQIVFNFHAGRERIPYCKPPLPLITRNGSNTDIASVRHKL